MANTAIARRLIPLLQMSTMSYKERLLWLIMIPLMDEKLLLKLEDSIKKESEGLTDLYMKALASE